MEYARQIVNSATLNSLIDLPLSLRDKLVEVIVLPIENTNTAEKLNYKCNLGFLDIPELPDSFFDPLPEEDLQAWGL